jgi:hypothetical protein
MPPNTRAFSSAEPEHQAATLEAGGSIPPTLSLLVVDSLLVPEFLTTDYRLLTTFPHSGIVYPVGHPTLNRPSEVRILVPEPNTQ